MSAKIRAINELKYARQHEEVDIDELQAVIDATETTIFAKRRAKIDIEKKLSVKNYTDKLLNDAIRELNCLYAEFKKYPTYTREQFEREEQLHFELSLGNQIDNNKLEGAASGALDALKAMAHITDFNTFLERTKNELTLQHPTE
jgi:hypothetical protein